MHDNKPNTLDIAKVGDGATHTIYTDSHAGTIVARTEKSITWQRDKATLVNGFGSDSPDKLQFTAGGFVGHTSGQQRYAFESDPEGELLKFSRRVTKYGRVVWKLVGHSTKSPGCSLSADRHEHYDFNF